jgi:hypothetical protein
MVRAKGVEPSLPREPDPKSGAVILNTYFPSKYATCFQFVPINLPTFSELPAQLPAQKPVRTAQTQTSLIRCSKLIPNRRRGGFPIPRAQFINNGFGLGEFLCKREMQIGIINRNEQLTDSLGLEKPKEGTN